MDQSMYDHIDSMQYHDTAVRSWHHSTLYWMMMVYYMYICIIVLMMLKLIYSLRLNVVVAFGIARLFSNNEKKECKERSSRFLKKCAAKLSTFMLPVRQKRSWPCVKPLYSSLFSILFLDPPYTHNHLLHYRMQVLFIYMCWEKKELLQMY